MCSRRKTLVLAAVFCVALCGRVWAGERHALFGDLHLHTGWSFDAYVNGTRTTPDHAYRYAKGEPIGHRVLGEVRIDVPLDFVAVTDHAEYYGVFRKLDDPASPVSKHPAAARLTSDDLALADMALVRLVFKAAYVGRGQLQPDPILYNEELMEQSWRFTIDSADTHYAPGEFTTFVGFEWTSTPTVNESIHRCLLFADTDTVPRLPYSSIDSNRPEDLWDWMEAQRARGARLLAIPHNINMSGGRLFALKDGGEWRIDAGQARRRVQLEPLVEITQIKGQSMVHPGLAPEDPFAGHEVFEFFYGPWGAGETKPLSYVRNVLGLGLQAQRSLGANPYCFGVVGGTDSHWSFSPVREKHYSRGGYIGTAEAQAMSGTGVKKRLLAGSGGLTGVWAEANTREAIFGALERKETFATSGTRIKVRFFGGWTYEPGLAETPDFAQRAYEEGVPMGRVLPERPAGAGAPAWLAWAQKDPNDGNLDRIQVVKGWLNEAGRFKQRVYDVAWAGGRTLDKETGLVPPVGNTVDAGTASYTNDIGAEKLCTVWRDPDFEAGQPAFYYLRVLQIPTPRWTTYDAVRAGVPPPEGVPVSIQERAWSSPIWYVPTPN